MKLSHIAIALGLVVVGVAVTAVVRGMGGDTETTQADTTAAAPVDATAAAVVTPAPVDNTNAA